MGTLRGLQSTRLKQLHHRRMLEGLGSHLSGAPGLQKKTFSTRKRHNKRLFAFVGLYWAYCIFWGIKGARASKTSVDYFVAGRSIGTWVFVLAATATSFSGWTFVGHPGKILTDGLPYAFASFYALTIPFTGVLFLRRQWILGRSFNYITPGQMYSDYYGGNIIRGLTVLVAFLFSVPFQHFIHLAFNQKYYHLSFRCWLRHAQIKLFFVLTANSKDMFAQSCDSVPPAPA